MKKLINILSAIAITGSSVSAVVACRKDNPNENNLTGTQDDMLEGAQFITKLILASRHENLNINVNELLSMFITPEASITRFPQSYVYNGKNINTNAGISSYKKFLAPSIATVDQAANAGTMASYVMGMYDNDFYKPIINGEYSFFDTMSQKGFEKYNQTGSKNATGYLAGLNKNLNLSDDEDRRNLAWGIQDTGPLTNYLLNKGFDGGTPGDTRADMGSAFGKPQWGGVDSNGGTNGSGFAYYNSLMAMGSAAQNDVATRTDVSKKLAAINSGLTYETSKADSKNYNIPTISDGSNSYKFNEVGSSILENAQTNNINGGISMFSAMLENLSTTNSGALLTTEFANYLMPFSASNVSTDLFIQGIGFSLVTSAWTGLKNIGADENFENLVGKDIFDKSKDLIEAPNPLPGTILNSKGDPNIIDMTVLKKYKGGSGEDIDLTDNGSNVKKVIELLDSLINDFNKKSDSDKKTFAEKLFKKDAPFGNAYSTIMYALEDTVWDDLVTKNNGQVAINLLKLVKQAYEMSLDDNVLEQVEKAKEIAGDNIAYRNLTNTQKSQITRVLGFDGSKFDEDSYLGKVYAAFKDSNTEGQKEFTDFFELLKGNVNTGMQDVHKNVYQYIFEDQYWKVKDEKVNVTSNEDLTGELEFTINYTGVGDSSSTASSQTKSVEVPQNFNPYQTILKNQTELLDEKERPSKAALDKIDAKKVSGEVLGVKQGIISEDELVNYDGTALLENYKPVNFEYKVKWKNISDDVSSPYWVISKIDCFKDGVQFYNIY